MFLSEVMCECMHKLYFIIYTLLEALCVADPTDQKQPKNNSYRA